MTKRQREQKKRDKREQKSQKKAERQADGPKGAPIEAQEIYYGDEEES